MSKVLSNLEASQLTRDIADAARSAISMVNGGRRVYGLKLSILGLGTGNLNFLVVDGPHRWVLRFHINARRANSAERFLLASGAVAAAPRLLAYIKYSSFRGWPLMVLEYVPGKDGTDYQYRLTPGRIGQLAARVADIHAATLGRDVVGKLPYATLGERLESRLNQIARGRPATDSRLMAMMRDIAERLIRRATERGSDSTLTLTHGNIWEGNAIFTPTTLRIIDYETAALGDPAMDVCHIFHDFRTSRVWSDVEKSLFMATYRGLRDDKTLGSRVKAYLPLDMYDSFIRIIEYRCVEVSCAEGLLAKGMASNTGRNYVKAHLKKMTDHRVVSHPEARGLKEWCRSLMGVAGLDR